MANLSRYSITKFDAYFSNDSLLYTSPDLYKIPVNPQIQYSSRIDDTLNWVEITVNFTAVGGERFLTIGNFQEGNLCDSLSTNVSTFLCCFAYYYIDDVSLEEDTITSIQEIPKTDFTIYPNPAKATIQISSQQILQEINVLDLRSKMMLQVQPAKTNAVLDISSLDNGIYIVQCRFKNGEVLYRKLVVEH